MLFVFFILYSFKIRENKRKMKENEIEAKSIVFNSNTWNFSGITSIAPSKDFSSETLTEVK